MQHIAFHSLNFLIFSNYILENAMCYILPPTEAVNSHTGSKCDFGYPQEFGPNYNGLVVDGEKIGF